MRTTVAAELNNEPILWNPMICHSDTCSWNFPSCLNNYIILRYNNFYVETSMCSEGLMASVGTGGTTKENGDLQEGVTKENRQGNESP